MRRLRISSLNFVVSICLVLVVTLGTPQVSLGQYLINTVAGGGPNNVPAMQSSIGYAASVALDSHGNAYIADSYSNQVFEVSATGTLTVVAGNGTACIAPAVAGCGDGGPATSAALNQPLSVYVDGSGNIFIADTGDCLIREVSGGNISTVAGNATLSQPCGYTGNGGPPTSAQLDEPGGVFVDSHGNIYIADADNSAIRVVNTGGSAITIGAVTIQPGTIETVVGNGVPCATYPCGDGGPAANAQLDEAFGVYLDSQQNIYIADTFDSVIRVVNPGTQPVTIANITIPGGDIQTVAGSYYGALDGTACQSTGDNGPATNAYLCLPFGLTVDGSGDIFIADYANFGIREVVPSGTISTVAGTLGTACTSYSNPATACGNGGSATGAYLNYPSGVALDTSDDVFIADSNDSAVREVVASSGDIQAFAGNSFLAYSGDGGPATSAELNFPGSTFVGASGNVYIADSDNSVIRVVNTGSSAVTINNVTIQPGDIQTVAGNGTACATPAPGGCGDGGLATSAQLNFPAGVFVDGAGDIYIADTGLPLSEDSVIRVVNTGNSPITIAGVSIPANSIETVAGTLGTAGYAGDGGSPTSAQLFNPNAVVLDGSGNIYIADTENSAIRVVNTGSQPLVIGAVSIAAGTIQTVAGTPPTACEAPSSGCGDGGPANSAHLSFPDGLALDSSGDIFVADTDDDAVRVVNPGTQPITIAGTVIQPGDILTVAGTLGQRGYTGDNGAPTSATLDDPWGVSVDSFGNIYIADTDNSAVREVVAVTDTIQTIAGTGTGSAGFSGDGGLATGAALNEPESVVLGSSGNLFIADTENSRIRQLTSTVTLTLAPTSATVPVNDTQQFLATVSGSSNTSVTWQVNGVIGGNATWGTVATDGLYQAPAAPPSPSTVTVTAIADANGTTAASAQVNIVAGNTPAVVVSTSPAGVTAVYTSSTQGFIATVTGEGGNNNVTWEVNNVPSGNSTVGTISSSGVYTAPSSVPLSATVSIVAVSQADSSVSGSYPIMIVTPPSGPPGGTQTVSPGGTAKYSLSLNANTGIPNQSLTLSCLQSSLPAGATCTFSPAQITPGSHAVPFTLAVNVPSSSASLHKQGGLRLAPHLYAALIPLFGVLLMGAGSRKRRLALLLPLLGMLLSALVACGGSSTSTTPPPETYTVQVQGTASAQPSPVTITTATLIVQ